MQVQASHQSLKILIGRITYCKTETYATSSMLATSVMVFLEDGKPATKTSSNTAAQQAATKTSKSQDMIFSCFSRYRN